MAKIIFLAAGRGLRMGSLTEAMPKAMIPLSDGRSILRTNIDNMNDKSLRSNTAIVGGHCFGQLQAYCVSEFSNLDIKCLFNEDFLNHGPARSFQIGLDSAQDHNPVVVANGDTIYSHDIFRAVFAVGPGVHLVVSKDPSIKPDDMAVRFSGSGSIEAVDKSPGSQGAGVLSAGFVIAKGEEARKQLHSAASYVVNQEALRGKQLPWHEMIASLAQSQVPVSAIEVSRSSWREFDYQECVAAYQHVT